MQFRGNFSFLDESTFIMVVVTIHENINCKSILFYFNNLDNDGLSLEEVNQRMHVLCIKFIGFNIE